MTREEAQLECERLTAEHPDRETHRFVPRKAEDGTWSVAKIGLPPADNAALTAETRADEKPTTADDPRDSFSRNVGGPWVGPG
jgi:hypothetical protein